MLHDGHCGLEGVAGKVLLATLRSKPSREAGNSEEIWIRQSAKYRPRQTRLGKEETYSARREMIDVVATTFRSI